MDVIASTCLLRGKSNRVGMQIFGCPATTVFPAVLEVAL
jgi:hypothetical protein